MDEAYNAKLREAPLKIMQLIDAAPDLLNALKAIVIAADERPYDCEMGPELLEPAEAAIAKATGISRTQE